MWTKPIRSTLLWHPNPPRKNRGCRRVIRFGISQANSFPSCFLFTNSLKIPELRQKIFFTLALLFIARVGANIPLPGVDPTPIKDFFEFQETKRADSGNDILGFYNMFTGGAL